ncbi:Retrovirus-related Pol poly from transposon, partial [Paramuricea clavata]
GHLQRLRVNILKLSAKPLLLCLVLNSSISIFMDTSSLQSLTTNLWNSRSRPSARLERHPLPNYYNTNTCKTPNLADDHIRFIAQNAVPIALGIEQLRKAVKQDSTLQALIEILQNNTWNSLATKQPDNTDIDLDELKAFKKIQHELSLTSDVDLILRENRLVIPKQLRKQVIQLAHEGHQGLVKTKKLIREKVWFPGIDALAAKAVKDCLACQSVGQPAKLAPLNPLPIPLQAWDTLYVDFLGPLSSKDLLLVVIDGRTRFPEVAIVRSTNAKSTITSLNRIFATHGLPRRIISDNGPPFQSEEFHCCHRQQRLERRVTVVLVELPCNTSLHNQKNYPNNQSYADQRRGAKQPNFKVGDQVLVRQQKRNKLTSKFNSKPYHIIKIKANTSGEHQVTRNCSHFKLFTGNSNTELSESDNESDVSVEDNAVGQPNIEVGQGRGEPRREIEEPVVEHRDGQRRYPQRRRNHPLLYRDEQNIR